MANEDEKWIAKGEPLESEQERAQVDWGEALDLALRRRDNERERLERIEGKVAPIIGGTVAVLGLFLGKSATPADCVIGLLLLIPLAMLFFTFRTSQYVDVPNLDTLIETYEWYPKTYIHSVISGTAEAVASNAEVIDRKARFLNLSMAILYLIIALIVVLRTSEVLHERHQQEAPAKAAAVTTHTKHNPTAIHPKPTALATRAP